MELSQLYYFRTTAELEHFTRAAAALHIAQPSLSKAISNLESELGVPLFEREGKRVRLNPYGKLYLEQVERILAELEDANLMLRDMQAGKRGRVRVGAAFPITQPSPVYYFHCEFFQQNPEITLSLHVHGAERIEQLLDQRDLDFGIVTAPAVSSGIESVPLYTDKLGVIVGPSHWLAHTEEISLEALSGEAFLCNSSAPDPNDSARHLCALAGFHPNIIYEGESSELIGEAVSMGRGISFVSEARYAAFQSRAFAPEWERSLHFVALKNDFCTRTVYLLRPTMGYRTAAAELFYQGLMAYLGE